LSSFKKHAIIIVLSYAKKIPDHTVHVSQNKINQIDMELLAASKIFLSAKTVSSSCWIQSHPQNEGKSRTVGRAAAAGSLPSFCGNGTLSPHFWGFSLFSRAL
jgi:hypothetical protein